MAPSMSPQLNQALIVDAVVIGRNESERLRAGLGSLQGTVRRVIYVDSGSTDDSVALAHTMGAQIVELDMVQPFTAARARNAGLAALAETPPDAVQFMDGDCEIREGWIELAREFLAERPDVVVVCGRRRERFSDASRFNRLCDEEWDTPVGETRACGGDAMIRYGPLTEAGGFREDLIAGEEPELCIRLRHAGGRIWRLDEEMTWHDAAITRLGQWAQRARRAGHAFAQGAALHGAPPERHWVRETRRALFWGAGLPILIVVLAIVHPAWVLLILAYPLQIARLALRNGPGRIWSWTEAYYLTLAKFPEARGVLDYWWRRMRRQKSELIEYK